MFLFEVVQILQCEYHSHETLGYNSTSIVSLPEISEISSKFQEVISDLDKHLVISLFWASLLRHYNHCTISFQPRNAGTEVNLDLERHSQIAQALHSQNLHLKLWYE